WALALRFGIDGLRLSVIARDGAPLQPVVVDNLVLNVGERFDVLLKAEQGGTHWVRAATLDGKEARAVLRYAGAPAGEPEATPAQCGERTLTPEAMRSREPVTPADKPRD